MILTALLLLLLPTGEAFKYSILPCGSLFQLKLLVSL